MHNTRGQSTVNILPDSGETNFSMSTTNILGCQSHHSNARLAAAYASIHGSRLGNNEFPDHIMLMEHLTKHTWIMRQPDVRLNFELT